MKKIIYSLVLLLALSTTVTSVSAADHKPKTELSDADKIKLENIKSRVAEIRKMDKSKLSKEERKALKSELKEMKKEAKAMGGGVYLSVGAIIIILLVLILIL